MDDTLLLVKNKDVNHINTSLNSSDQIFLDGNIHFLYIEGNKNHTNNYYKDTHTEK